MDVVILTSMEVEYQSVRAYLSQVVSKVIDAQKYEFGVFKGKFYSYNIAIRLAGAQNTSVALAAEYAIKHFQPSIIILGGIAGGIKDVDVGDIVVGTKVYSYDSGKENKDGFIVRPEVLPFDSELVHFARSFAKTGNWQKKLSKKVKVFFGPIASGNKVIASTESTAYNLLEKNYTDTLAIDMESIGFANAVSSYPHLRSMDIRSISDLLENKSRAEWKEGRTTSIHNFTLFLFEFLLGLEFEKIRPVLMNSKELAQMVINLIFPLIKLDPPSADGLESLKISNPTVSKIWEKVKPIFIEEFEIEDELDDAKIATRSHLRKVINKDSELQISLTNLIKKLEQEGTLNPEHIIITDSKNVIQGSDIKVGGDFHLGDRIDNKISNKDIQIGNRIIFQILEGNDKWKLNEPGELSSKIDAYESDRLKDIGRAKIQDFGKAASSNWNQHAWHLLGQALNYFAESIGKNLKNQHSWTNLAYTYYLIGEPEKTNKCLAEAKRLAKPGPNYPGRHYTSVENAIQNNITLSGWKISRPNRPPWFDEKYLI